MDAVDIAEQVVQGLLAAAVFLGSVWLVICWLRLSKEDKVNDE